VTLRDVPYGQTLAMRPIARAAGPLFALDDALLLPSPARSPRWRPIRIESLLQQRCHALTQSNRPPGEQNLHSRARRLSACPSHRLCSSAGL